MGLLGLGSDVVEKQYAVAAVGLDRDKRLLIKCLYKLGLKSCELAEVQQYQALLLVQVSSSCQNLNLSRVFPKEQMKGHPPVHRASKKKIGLLLES